MPLAAENGAPALHDEAWLRDLLFEHPELLPIGEIEPVLDPLVSACIELPLPAGNADNLFLNPNGGIALVECKLWRNPEARRKVVAQVIDYARCLSTWRYSDLELAIARASVPRGAKPPARMADLFRPTDFDEASFVDNVNRNLKRGRIVLILAGDGIREDAEALVDLVQDTVGTRFTWALVEMPVFQLPDQLGFIVQPRLVARTVMIERGVVSISDDRIRVVAPSDKEMAIPKSITEEEFFESVAKLDARIPDALRAFIGAVANVGVRPVFKGAMNLRWMGPDGVDRSLGYVQKDGQVWFDPVDRKGADSQEREAADMYLSAIARGIGGTVKNFPNSEHRSVYMDNHAPRISRLLAAQSDWINAIQAFADRIRTLKSN
jgi:hypothetical protein